MALRKAKVDSIGTGATAVEEWIADDPLKRMKLGTMIGSQVLNNVRVIFRDGPQRNHKVQRQVPGVPSKEALTRNRGVTQRLFSMFSALSLALLSGSCIAEQAPAYNVTKFDPNAKYRTNLCKRQRQLFIGNISLADALEGLDLTVALPVFRDPVEKYLFSLDQNGAMEESHPLFFAIILDELSNRAGFRWRNSFAAIPILNLIQDGNKTYSDLLEWQVDAFDISAGRWDRSLARLERQISFPEGFYDSSVILVHAGNNQNQKLQLFSFLEPFEWTVWVILLLSLLVSGVAYWFLENLNTTTDERHLEGRSPGSSIFYTALIYTGHFEFRPQTAAAMLLTFSLTLLGLLLTAVYTANLVSFLVARRQPTYTVETLSEAALVGAPVCVREKVNMQEYIVEKYPSAVLVTLPSEADVYWALQAGFCEVAAVPISEFNVYERDADVNGDCSLAWHGRVERFVPGGFASAVDSGTLCTSLVTHVLDYHFLEMKVDGFLEREWEAHLQRVSTTTCVDKSAASNNLEETTYSLTLQEMAGIFIVHAFMLLLALSVALGQFVWRRRQSNSREEAMRVADEESSQEKETDEETRDPFMAESGAAMDTNALGTEISVDRW